MNVAEVLSKISHKQLHASLARKKFEHFMTYIKPNFEVNWHHRRECEAIDDFIDGKIKKLMIFQPPQTGKSEVGSRGFPAYVLGRKPNTRLAVCSYSAHLAEGFNRACQGYIDSDAYKEIFPNTKLYSGGGNGQDGKALRNSEIFGIVGYEGFFKSVGVTGPLTGTPLDIGIIDDPFKDRIEADSERIRERVWDWYLEVFSTRMHNDSQELLMMTRWHDDDLAGRLLKQDDEREARGEAREWTVISFAGLKEGPPTEFDPRQDGEALWPERHSRERYLQQKQRAPRTFQSLYQQNPTEPGGNIIKTEYITRISYQDFLGRCAKRKPVWDTIMDPAFDIKKVNDPSALMEYCEMDNCMFIRNVKSVKMELPTVCRYIPEFMIHRTRRSWLEIEPKASGKSIVPAIRQGTKTINVKEYKYPKVDGTRMDDKDKVTRAWAVTDQVESGRVYVIEGPYVDSFFKQLQDFPNAAHDDEVDCFVMAALKIFYRKRKKGVTTRG